MIVKLPLAIALSVLVLMGRTPLRAGDAVVELQTSEQTWQGRSLAHDKRVCWLVEKTGELHDVTLADVTSFRRVPGRFSPETVVQARERFSRTMPRGMEVTARGHYVVAAPAGKAGAYAELLDDVYADFWGFFSRRQFPIQKPEFPLIVLIFPSKQQFAEYAKAENTPVPPGLKGYYHRRTNRIAVYVDEGAGVASSTQAAPSATVDAGASWTEIAATVEGDLRTTLIHEATHQLAYNTGLHSRMGDHPRWMSEGLAMLLEEDSRRDDAGSRSPEDRLNRSRYLWFMNYRQERRQPGALGEFVATNRLFDASSLDAYSEAWALSFYLIETRRADYARYLQTIAARDPLLPYTEQERLADFTALFGTDLKHFDGQYQLFYDRMTLR